MPTNRKLVILNQASNYLTIGFANAFKKEFDEVVLMTGSVHVQGEELDSQIKIQSINRWYESPASKKMKSYLLAMFKMWWLLMTKYRKHEVYFVSVPPMGYLLNIFLPHRFSMVIWDVYPDIFKITGMQESHPVYRIWAWLNRRSFKKAYRIFTISEKMAELLYQYVSPSKVLVQPIWSIFQDNKKVSKSENPFIQEHNLQGKFIIQYSGNIGLTHNVEALVDIAELLQNETNILVQIIGRGPRKAVLERVVNERQLPNCQFLPFQSDEMFPYSLGAADMGVVILDESTSKGSVPSKSYNLMSYGIPSLYIASEDSQLALYADKYEHGKCFKKSDLQAAADWIVEVAKKPEEMKRMSENAVAASSDFKRANADKFVAAYCQESN
ncbi:glycosyltransferase family 4 protein [Croceimicrobium hydrocarbonivorans]|uniref:Glycosyltransferase family 4 protein n=1 Tax=Croceimicrobium hydrocarbonivorans TaxID=2761580 RepID=A0A7H0VGA1_9FLAO|nr:glycosyltransferase family 4 protein [Croceimicrobium hydrocarbonivorans]QNR24749.1 glycosyltransferase family 4 protein [Croceimicrobium hydrocarbonivorans]